VGLADWYPPNYDCGACGYATCAEFLHATKALRDESAELEFAGPTCNLRDIDLGVAVGSAAKTAAIHSIDCRCQTRVAVAARKLGVIRADVAVALSLSMTHKAVGFDRRMPDADFDTLELPGTGTLPVGVQGESRHGGARNRQQPRGPRAPLTSTQPKLMIAVAAGTFTHGDIALTAAITGGIAAVFAVWRLSGPRRLAAGLGVGVLAGVAVYPWRASADMPQLNNDGLSRYSANDWLAPVVTFVILSIYADLIPPTNPHRLGQVRAAPSPRRQSSRLSPVSPGRSSTRAAPSSQRIGQSACLVLRCCWVGVDGARLVVTPAFSAVRAVVCALAWRETVDVHEVGTRYADSDGGMDRLSGHW
jgi:hypothetical protein